MYCQHKHAQSGTVMWHRKEEWVDLHISLKCMQTLYDARALTAYARSVRHCGVAHGSGMLWVGLLLSVDGSHQG